MKKLLYVELQHCIDRISYKIIVLCLVLTNMLSYILCIQNDIKYSYQFIRSANENFILQGTEAAYIPYMLMSFFPMLAIIIWALSLNKETQNNNHLLFVQRIGSVKYLCIKVVVIIGVTFITIVIPLLLNLVACHMTYPQVGYDNAWGEAKYLIGIYSYSPEFFIDRLRLQSPTIYNLIYVFNYGIIGVGFALLGLGLSFMRAFQYYYYIKIPIIIFMIYTIQNMMLSLLGYGKYSMWNYLATSSQGDIVSYLIMILVLYSIDIILIYRGIKKYECI